MHPELATAGKSPRAVYRLLMIGGTFHLPLAVLARLSGPLTCAAALWAIAGLYAAAELLRPAVAPSPA